MASPVPHAEILRFVQTLAPDLPLKIYEVDGVLRPNEMLAEGEIDANFFQHEPYLRQQEKDLKTVFRVVARVHIEPLGIYSRKIRSLDELARKSTVSVPNNIVNLSRALFLLQDQGLIRLRPDLTERGRQQASELDIVSNPKVLKIVPIESAFLARSLDDVMIGVVNGNNPQGTRWPSRARRTTRTPTSWSQFRSWSTTRAFKGLPNCSVRRESRHSSVSAIAAP